MMQPRDEGIDLSDDERNLEHINSLRREKRQLLEERNRARYELAGLLEKVKLLDEFHKREIKQMDTSLLVLREALSVAKIAEKNVKRRRGARKSSRSEEKKMQKHDLKVSAEKYLATEESTEQKQDLEVCADKYLTSESERKQQKRDPKIYAQQTSTSGEGEKNQKHDLNVRAEQPSTSGVVRKKQRCNVKKANNGNSFLTQKEARLIALLSQFLILLPFGANLHQIYEYVNRNIDCTLEKKDVENFLKRVSSVFNKRATFVSSLNENWRFIAMEKK